MSDTSSLYRPNAGAHEALAEGRATMLDAARADVAELVGLLRHALQYVPTAEDVNNYLHKRIATALAKHEGKV